LITDH